MSLGTSSLDAALSSMSRYYNSSQDSMSQSLARIASGKRFTKASEDFAGYSKKVDLDINYEKFGRIGGNMSELGATLDQAIDASNSVMDDLKNMKSAWSQSESYTAGSEEQLAAADLAAGYQDSIKEALKITSSDGKTLIDGTSATWAQVTMTGDSTLTVDLSGETVATGTEATAAATQTSIDNMTSYIGKLESYKATVGSQENMANTMKENTKAVESAITSIDDAKEMANYVDQDIRSQATISMMAQANLSRRNISLLYR